MSTVPEQEPEGPVFVTKDMATEMIKAQKGKYTEFQTYKFSYVSETWRDRVGAFEPLFMHRK